MDNHRTVALLMPGKSFHRPLSSSGALRRLQTVEVSDRDQRPEAEGEEGEPEDPMADVACLECGRGDDDEHLLLCDGALSMVNRVRLSVWVMTYFQ